MSVLPWANLFIDDLPSKKNMPVKKPYFVLMKG